MWPSKSVFQALTPSSLLQGVPALCPLLSSLRIPKSCPGLFPRILAGLTPAGLFGLHPLPRLYWGRWWLPNGGGVRQGSPSWFLLNLCCLLFPVPVARSPGLSLCCGSLSCPPYPPPCLLLKKGKWVSWAGSSPGALKLPVLSPTQVPTYTHFTNSPDRGFLQNHKVWEPGAPVPEAVRLLHSSWFCRDDVTTLLLSHFHSTSTYWSSTLGSREHQMRPMPFGHPS